MSSQPYIPYREIPLKLAISAGDSLMVASDLTRLAMAALRKEGEFSPDRLIDSFLQTLGPEGTLIIPSFNFNLKNNESYHPQNTPPITGALAEAAFGRKDFIRTYHPLHSFLVKGRYAQELAGRRNSSSFGEDSPFSFYKENNALMLMIGTSVTDAFTFVHYAEEIEQVKYRRYKTIRLKYGTGDREMSWKDFRLYSKKPGWTMNLSALEKLFRDKGILEESSFNGVSCSQIRLGNAFPVIREDILSNHAKSISRFDPGLFFREIVKNALSSLHLYRTLTEKISHAPGTR